MIRKVAIAIWVCIILAGLISYFVWPQVFTARNIADRMASVEGQEGLGLFFEKRKPKWFP